MAFSTESGKSPSVILGKLASVMTLEKPMTKWDGLSLREHFELAITRILLTECVLFFL
jgi:hypothetical protein